MYFPVVTATVFLIIKSGSTVLPSSSSTQDCISNGTFCKSCNQVIDCVQIGSTFTETVVQTCPKDRPCLKSGCSTVRNPKCDGTADIDFVCTHVGTFLDPFYCDRFHVCTSNNATVKPMHCEPGLGFNITTGFCDIKLAGGRCKDDTYPLPLCDHAGEAAPFPQIPEVYYICTTFNQTLLYPIIYVCPNGQTFSNFRCGS